MPKADLLTRWHGAIRSYLLALQASRRYGRSTKLRRAGRLPEALQAARDGLALLREPHVRRQEGPEGSNIVCLTIEVESLAHQLGEPGACRADLEDTVLFFRSLPADVRENVRELCAIWLPYLEERLARDTDVA